MARDDIADYGAYLAEERHASQNTVSSYLRDVTQFSEYLADRHGASLRQADADTVQEYMGWMRGRGKSAASVTRFLASHQILLHLPVLQGRGEGQPRQGDYRRPGGAEIP